MNFVAAETPPTLMRATDTSKARTRTQLLRMRRFEMMMWNTICAGGADDSSGFFCCVCTCKRPPNLHQTQCLKIADHSQLHVPHLQLSCLLCHVHAFLMKVLTMPFLTAHGHSKVELLTFVKAAHLCDTLGNLTQRGSMNNSAAQL